MTTTIKTAKINPFIGTADNGWINKQNHLWWLDPTQPYSFTFFDPDSAYPDQYYANGHDVTDSHVKVYCDTVIDYYKSIKNVDLSTLLEVGCGGGWFTAEFARRGLKVTAFDASQSGVDRARARVGTKDNVRIFKHDIRDKSTLIGRYDVICCSEVAEHIEPPFAGLLVQTLTKHSDVIIWSHARPHEHAPCHIHHPNEQPDRYWISLFAFFGYKAYSVPNEIVQATKQRIKFIFVKE